MLCRWTCGKRKGASVLEAAVVLPAALFLLLGILVGGMGIFAYQQVAHLARETARFASVHGGQYAKRNAAVISAGTLPSVDSDYLVGFAKSHAAGLDASRLQVSVSMTVLKPAAASASDTETVTWDNTTENQNRSPYSAWTDNSQTPPSNVQLDNMVIVQISYSWSPELFGIGPITLTSTAVMPMSY